jgi:hypothetical protein
LFEALDFLTIIIEEADTRLKLVKTVSAVYSIMIVLISLLSYSLSWVAVEELLMTTLELAVITVVWALICLNEDTFGVWSLPQAALYVRSEIESDKHLAERLIMFTDDSSVELNEILDQSSFMLVEPHSLSPIKAAFSFA